MWSDNETTVDLLNVRHIVGAVLELVKSPTLTPVTIGVFGDWGSGKSSVVRMVERVLESEEGVVCVYFNGWQFEGYEDAKTALMTSILERIAEKRSPQGKALQLTKRLMRRVDWFRLGRLAVHLKLAAMTAGVSVPVSIATELAGAQGHTLSGDEEAASGDEEDLGMDKLLHGASEQGRSLHRTVRDFEKEFAELLKETGVTRLVVVIDDLDRCLPDRVIETLEAIRLFLAVPGTAFVISADEVLVQQAVKLRFPALEGARAHVGRDYLEKMIQVPVRIPPLAPQEIETYLALLFTQLHLPDRDFKALLANLVRQPANPSSGMPPFNASNAGLLIESSPSQALLEDLTLAGRIAEVVSLSVDGNPRQIKRYLNAVRLRMHMAKGRGVALPSRLASKLMLLEYFRPEAFRQLGRWQAANRGRATELAALEQHRKAAREGSDAHIVAEPPEVNTTTSQGDTGTGAATNREIGAHAMTQRSAGGGARRGSKRADVENTAQVSSPLPSLRAEAQAWLSDVWLSAWLDIEPALGSADLTPYYSFARERLLGRGSAAQRLSIAAQELFPLLLSPATSVRGSAAKRTQALMAPDASALHDALAERLRLTDDLNSAVSPINGLFELVTNRPDLGPEFIALLRSLPVADLGPGVPPRLLGALGTSASRDAAHALLDEWARQSTNAVLSVAARTMLDGLHDSSRRP